MKKWLLTTTFILAISLPRVIAIDVDSLVSLWPKMSDSLKVDSVIKLARMNAINMRGDRSISYAKWALSKSRMIRNEPLYLRAHFYLAAGFDEADQIDSSIVHYKKVLNEVKGSSMNWLDIHITNNLAMQLGGKGRYDEALEYYFEGMRIAEEREDSSFAAKFMTEIGYCFDRNKEYKQAIEWHRKALKQYRLLGDEFSVYFVKGRIGIAYDDLGIYDSAHYYNLQALNYSIQINDSFAIGGVASNIGNTYMKQKEWQKAKDYLEMSLDMNLTSGDSWTKAISAVNLGHTYTKLKEYEKARESLLFGINQAKLGSSLQFISEGYYRFYQLYYSLNYPDSALHYFRLHTDLEDSLYNLEKTKQIAEIETRYETEKQQQQIALQEAQLNEKEQALSARRRLIIVLILGFILITLSLGFAYYRYKKRKKAELQQRVIEEQEKSIDAVIHAQEEERKRISKELHDGIGQQLSGLKMAFQKLGTSLHKAIPEKGEEIDTMAQVLSEAADEVRSISHQMMPRALLEFGLIEAIQDLTHKAFKPLEIEFDFEHFNLQNRYSERIEVSVYRIIQELINNIIKHADANKVNIQLFENNNKLILIVEDNGKGFSDDRAADGHGLLNIKSRLNTVNGEVNFEPSPASGSIATIRIQLQ